MNSKSTNEIIKYISSLESIFDKCIFLMLIVKQFFLFVKNIARKNVFLINVYIILLNIIISKFQNLTKSYS